jgi:phospholipase/carboxylesterase
MDDLKVMTIGAMEQPAMGALVVLHGWGANAEDAAYFTGMLPLAKVDRFLPEGPFNHPYSDVGRMWYSLDNITGFDGDLSHQADLQTSRQLLTDWLLALPGKTGIPLERTILGGFSQGGAMTIEVGLTLPLAGLMILSGYLHKSLANIPKPPMPILQIHGQQDMVVPIAAARKTRDALLALGSNLTYQEFPGLGHEVSMTVLEQMQGFVTALLEP